MIMSNESLEQPSPLKTVDSTTTSGTSETLTIEMLEEAAALIKVLTPKEAPEGLFLIKGMTGLNIIKNNMIPENTVMVSKRLFDLIFESSNT
jgi:hypothetical protein